VDSSSARSFRSFCALSGLFQKSGVELFSASSPERRSRTATSKMPPERIDTLLELVQLFANLTDREHASPF
jgi:hypothetical protein